MVFELGRVLHNRLRYDEAAAKLTWQRTVDFFNKNLRSLPRYRGARNLRQTRPEM